MASTTGLVILRKKDVNISFYLSSFFFASPAHSKLTIFMIIKSSSLAASRCTILVCILAILVQLVSSIDGKSHSSNDNHHGRSCHKESGIASQHGYFGSKVASSDSHSLGGVVFAIVVLAA